MYSAARCAALLVLALAACSGRSSSGFTPAAPAGAVAPHAKGSMWMTHVYTGDYLGGKYGTHKITWGQAAPYLTWAETSSSDANAIHAAGIKTLAYVDPNRTAPGNPLYNNDETTFAHTCDGYRIYDIWDNVQEWLMNPASPSLQSLYAQYVSGLTAKTHFDALFEDEAGALSGYEPYDPFEPSLPCYYADAAWLSAQIAMNQVPSRPILFNGLNVLNGDSPSLSIQLLAGSNTIGGNYEGCYSTESDPKEDGWLWQDVENTELQVNAQKKLFECMLRETDEASSQIDARIYAYASFLLLYNPTTDVYWTYFSTPSGLHVMPESELVVLSPTTATPASIAGLKQPGGTYARQYNDCYLKASLIGPCAVVVNSDYGTSHPFPFSTYHHTLTLSGDGVLDGGAVSTSGPPPPSSVPSMEAEIVFP
ncbi:MAG: hypothetical protein WA814_07350 [Candidatus Baltobacteraceae bacterium]